MEGAGCATTCRKRESMKEFGPGGGGGSRGVETKDRIAASAARRMGISSLPHLRSFLKLKRLLQLLRCNILPITPAPQPLTVHSARPIDRIRTHNSQLSTHP